MMILYCFMRQMGIRATINEFIQPGVFALRVHLLGNVPLYICLFIFYSLSHCAVDGMFLNFFSATGFNHGEVEETCLSPKDLVNRLWEIGKHRSAIRSCRELNNIFVDQLR